MTNHRRRHPLRVLSALLMVLITLAVPALVSAAPQVRNGQSLDSDTRFYVPKPNHDAVEQIAELRSQGRKADAALIGEIIDTPTAVWVESGSPKGAEQQVRQITHQAAGKKTIPVLVLYNIPFRDCAQYSAGGATSVEEYKAWIDGVGKGIGNRKAVIILEPDSLGIIPWYTNIDGNLEWCQPAEADPNTAAAERFEMLNYAVTQLTALPNTSIYLDGTHNAWLNVGDISQRLVRAGVAQADGFFLNASNYQWTENLSQYGAWISSCIAYATEVNPGAFSGCPNQYWNGGPSTGWQGAALDPSRVWSDGAAELALNTTGINERYAGMLGDVAPTTHFVIDTSRNGRGPWTPPAGVYPDPQDWCNPPNRGIGLRPTTNTSNPLVDAYLWIKVPGESDGQCSRGLGPTGTVDPEWGVVDPAAGQWFPQQALELAKLANPPLK